MGSVQELLRSLRSQLAQDEIGLVLDQLRSCFGPSTPELRDEIALLTARYNRLRRNERRGVVSYEVAEADRTRLTSSLLAFLEVVPAKVSEEMSPIIAPTLAAEEVAVPDQVHLDKIMGVNNLKQIPWIERGLKVSTSICRVLTPTGLGTGFLISPELVMTNNHVIPSPATAASSVVEFNYQHDFEGNILPTCRYRLDPARFLTNSVLDYTIAGVVSDTDRPSLSGWGHVLLNPFADPVPGEHVIIVQHPNGGLKQIVLTANQVVSLWGHRIHYTTDTMPGSSGAPVFNDLWQVIAIHHGGGELRTNASGDKRFVNEGVLMSAIKPDAGSLWPQ